MGVFDGVCLPHHVIVKCDESYCNQHGFDSIGMAILPEHQLALAIVIGLSASTAMYLPVSTPPNAMAFSTGLLEQKDFRTGGLLIGILGPALIVAWVLFVSSM